MRLTGYSDRWSVGRGETLRFFVSSAFERYRAQLVRLIHGDTNPRGPGLKTIPIDAPVNTTYVGLSQAIHTGSYVNVSLHAGELARGGLTLMTFLQPTAILADQGLMSSWDNTGAGGFGLFINAATRTLEGRIRLVGGATATVCSRRTLRLHEWYFAALSFDPQGRSFTLRTDLLRPSPFDAPREVTQTVLAAEGSLGTVPLLLGAGSLADVAGRTYPQHCFNGKLSSPLILPRGVSRDVLEKQAPIELMSVRGTECVARWDFAADPGLRRIKDISGHGHDGIAVNRPTRAVTGHNWTAVTDSFREAPEQYNAIHFHDDDLEDAGWSESFRYDVPQGLRSGVYAIEISSEDGVTDFLPFFVRPETGRPEACIAVLIPTLSYLAYSNESLDLEPFEFLSALCPLRNMALQPEEYEYIQGLNLKSTYDTHRDGSGICHTTMLRPSLTSMRPSHRCRLFDGPHQLSADLHLIDWLEEKKIAYDVITDHDLHREGAPLLQGYRAILTGTHAEYWSKEMLEGLGGYQQAGGRLVYLSGNGLYWVTALDPETQTVAEVRRTNGSRSWQAKPGEGRFSFTGEPGGIWSWRGRAPQKSIGVGFAAQGFDRGAPYRRTVASRDPRCAFLFDGIDSELLGDFPVLVMNYGAAGYEVDRVDPGWGTPAHALVIATSLRLSDSYQFAIEDVPVSMPSQGGLNNANVRADMVFYETPNGGAVFSASSISFCSALSFNGYRNDISRLLENVITAFSAEILPGGPHVATI